MRRLLFLAVVVVLLLAAVPSVLAYDRVQGCVTDKNNAPWTFGGSITCTRQGNIVVGSGSLDANGCFEVFIGNGTKATCTIDFNPSPQGDPVNAVCTVPTNNDYPPVPYSCGPIQPVGPNAINLGAFQGASAPVLSASLAVLLFGLSLGGVGLARRFARASR